MEEDYISINKTLWNKKTEVHVQSEFYDVNSFLNGKSSLNDIELNLLGDIKGKTILHLQCHFGQDSISLSRLGAEVTGVDFSDTAIEMAQQYAHKTEANTQFICCNVYDLPQHLNKQFDIVYTSYGTIGWLPNLEKWAQVISQFLKPKGQFVFVEFHPVVWIFDNDFKFIEYNYFKSLPIIETETGTYADKSANVSKTSVSWNHSLSEVLNSLIKQKLEINSFEEYDYSPYNCFNNTIEYEANKFRIQHLENKIPMLFSVVATKKNY